MVDYSQPRVHYEKNRPKNRFKIFWGFYIDPGGLGGHPGGSRTDSGAEKHEKNEIFENVQKIAFLF